MKRILAFLDAASSPGKDYYTTTSGSPEGVLVSGIVLFFFGLIVFIAGAAQGAFSSDGSTDTDSGCTVASFSVAPTSIVLSSGDDSHADVVLSSASPVYWHATSNDSSIKINPSSGTTQKGFKSISTVTLSTSDFRSARTAKVTFTDEAGMEAIVSVKVKQGTVIGGR